MRSYGIALFCSPKPADTLHTQIRVLAAASSCRGSIRRFHHTWVLNRRVDPGTDNQHEDSPESGNTPSCLNELEGQRLGIISNGDLTEQMFKLGKISHRDYFDPVIAAGDVGVAKPDPGIFRIACERASVDIQDCVYVGDDIEIDILSAIEAGMNGIWLNRKHDDLALPKTTMIHALTELKGALPNPRGSHHSPSK